MIHRTSPLILYRICMLLLEDIESSHDFVEFFKSVHKNWTWFSGSFWLPNNADAFQLIHYPVSAVVFYFKLALNFWNSSPITTIHNHFCHLMEEWIELAWF